MRTSSVDHSAASKARLNGRAYPASRFSDGSFPVFYSALEIDTARAEAHHWFRQFVDKPNGERIARYARFACDFEGTVMDLRPMQPQEGWEDLTSDADYGFCNRLGAEAREDVDGFFAPSVRHAGGTNVPVFRRSALSNVRGRASEQFVYTT